MDSFFCDGTLKVKAAGEWVRSSKTPGVRETQSLLFRSPIAKKKQHDEGAEYQAEEDCELGSVDSQIPLQLAYEVADRRGKTKNGGRRIIGGTHTDSLHIL